MVVRVPRRDFTPFTTKLPKDPDAEHRELLKCVSCPLRDAVELLQWSRCVEPGAIAWRVGVSTGG